MNKDKEFYIGYSPKAPKKIGKTVKWVSVFLLLVICGISFLMISNEKPFDNSTFEFGVYNSYEGIVMENPYPRILIERPGDTGLLPKYSQYYLVQFGKFGGQEMVEGLDGKTVTLEGALIYRDDQTMIEMKENSISHSDHHSSESRLDLTSELPEKSLGEYTLKGEIVDSKCFYGVMNPGNLKVHKACAINCIRGGIPPVFIVKDELGNIGYYLLQDKDGNAVNKNILDKIAEPLEIKGEVIKQGDLLILKADPYSYTNL